LNRSATNIPSACKTANIAQNDAMILPHDANPGRMGFSERTREGTSDKDKQKAPDRYYGGAFASALAGESTLTCWRRIRFSASSLALDLKSEARTWGNSLNKSIIRQQAYPVCSSRPSRIEFSVHTGFAEFAAKTYGVDVVALNRPHLRDFHDKAGKLAFWFRAPRRNQVGLVVVQFE
jgi:hypothetical protein